MAKPHNKKQPAIHHESLAIDGPPGGILNPGVRLPGGEWAEKNAARCRARRFFFCEGETKKIGGRFLRKTGTLVNTIDITFHMQRYMMKRQPIFHSFIFSISP